MDKWKWAEPLSLYDIGWKTLPNQNVQIFLTPHKQNTSLAAKGALAHCLQHLTACLIQNGRCGLEISQTLCYWTPCTTFTK